MSTFEQANAVRDRFAETLPTDPRMGVEVGLEKGEYILRVHVAASEVPEGLHTFFKGVKVVYVPVGTTRVQTW